MTPQEWMARYAVESQSSDSFAGHVPDVFLVCLECRKKGLDGRRLIDAGIWTVPELGCLGPWVPTPQLGLEKITEMVMNHEEGAHSS